MSWQTVLGFEVHIELATRSKMFCGCPADHFGKTPNSQTCPVCLGLPGALPVPNVRAVEWCIKLGLALNCQINRFSKFDRKNYFYPDLPKGYQISQYDQPFGHSGHLFLSSGKKIRITRVHLEEDTGKLQHAVVEGKKVSLIDFNRSGVPLVEIVTEPDFTDSSQSDEFLKEIPPYKVEVKNVNSFRFIKKAVDFEISRHIKLLESGKTPKQETRGYSESLGGTVSQRSKEEAHDYRYFPEPDIPPMTFTNSQINKWLQELPPLPEQIRSELISNFTLSSANAAIIASNQQMYNIFTQAVSDPEFSPKAIADVLINKRYGPVLPKTGNDLIKYLKSLNQTSISDSSQITEAVKKIISANPRAIADIKSGKQQALFYLIGLIKRDLGNVDISLVKKILIEQIL